MARSCLNPDDSTNSNKALTFNRFLIKRNTKREGKELSMRSRRRNEVINFIKGASDYRNELLSERGRGGERRKEAKWRKSVLSAPT